MQMYSTGSEDYRVVSFMSIYFPPMEYNEAISENIPKKSYD